MRLLARIAEPKSFWYVSSLIFQTLSASRNVLKSSTSLLGCRTLQRTSWQLSTITSSSCRRPLTTMGSSDGLWWKQGTTRCCEKSICGFIVVPSNTGISMEGSGSKWKSSGNGFIHWVKRMHREFDPDWRHSSCEGKGSKTGATGSFDWDVCLNLVNYVHQLRDLDSDPDWGHHSVGNQNQANKNSQEFGCMNTWFSRRLDNHSRARGEANHGWTFTKILSYNSSCWVVTHHGALMSSKIKWQRSWELNGVNIRIILLSSSVAIATLLDHLPALDMTIFMPAMFDCWRE